MADIQGPKPQHLIQEGDTVIFDENGEKKSFIKLKRNGTVKIGKSHLSMAPFIGVPFGAVFTLSADGQAVERVTECPKGEWASQMVTTTARTNEGLFDRNEDNQKLSADDIEAMKKEGKGGIQIVEALCSNSATFHQKTEFAQEKYRKKKVKKYVCQITLRRPTARTIAEAYFEKGPERVFNLRPDTLSMMLSLGNVAAGAKVLVLDTVMGVVTAAVVERLGGLGHVCNTYVDRPVTMDASKSLNLAPGQSRTCCSAALHMLHEVKALGPILPTGPGGSSDATAEATGISIAVADSAAAAAAAGTSTQAGTAEGMEVEGGAAVQQGGDAAVVQEQVGQKRGRQDKHQGQGRNGADAGQHQLGPKTGLLHSLVYPGFSSAVIAAPKLQATAVMNAVLPLLAPSATFVVYSPSVQPLADCLNHLRVTHQAVMLQLHESWLRPYQVLPARTHPTMMCDGTGGYIMSGIKVLPADSPFPAAVKTKGKQGKQQKGAQAGAAAGADTAAVEAAGGGAAAQGAEHAAAGDAQAEGVADGADVGVEGAEAEVGEEPDAKRSKQ